MQTAILQANVPSIHLSPAESHDLKLTAAASPPATSILKSLFESLVMGLSIIFRQL